MAEMRPEDVPAELVRAAMVARWDLAYPDTACRSILAAALPLHEQQMRAELEQLRETARVVNEGAAFYQRKYDEMKARAESAEILVRRYQARALLGTDVAEQQPEDGDRG